MKKALLLAAGIIATGLIATTANAAPLGSLASNAATVDTAPGVILVHNGDHRSCELGRRGWHYNDRRGNRVECRPRRPGFRYWEWKSEGNRTGWYHSRDRRWN
jgi:hypothetical protein